MNNFTIDASQLRRLDKSLTSAGKDYKKGVKRLLKDIGVRVSALADVFCPESPQLKDYKKMNKSGKSKRKHITTRSLAESIKKKVGKDFVSIHIPSNTKGGKYAEKIHDKKGVSWHELGVRSKQKPGADEKFIYRAYDAESKHIDDMIDGIIRDMTKGIGV